MFKTTAMSLIELMILKEDIKTVIEFLGKKGNFQFQSGFDAEKTSDLPNPDGAIYQKFVAAMNFLWGKEFSSDLKEATLPTAEERSEAMKILSEVDVLHEKEVAAGENLKKTKEAYSEAVSFANLKVPYDQLEHMSFLTLRIGKIDPKLFDEIVFAVGNRAVIIPLGNDRSKILAASSKKGRFSLDSELKKFGFVEMEVPENFRGVPDDVLASLSKKLDDCKKEADFIGEEKVNFSKTHEEAIVRLANNFSIASQIQEVQSKLESTSMVYRVTGWLPEKESHQMMKDLDSITEGRIAIRLYNPLEVPSVVSGREKVPVKVEHGKFVRAFERMIFSYGSPTYGAIDPTPFVAVFFTILFGIMFGDAGQGLVFLLAGVLMAFNVIKVGSWNKFAPIFIAIGCTSTVMGILTGEFFANEEILLPVSRALKMLFGVTDPEKLGEPILHMMPSAERVKFMFMFFAFTIAVGFVINSCGLVLNIVNSFIKKHPGKAIFGKTGISGMAFFYYVVFFAIRIAATGHTPKSYDWIIISLTLFFTAFGEIFERLVDGERPVMENGFGTAVIQAAVEVLEVISSYLSNSISFLRVGAFALAHAVLGYIISSMSALAGGAGGVAISVFGNLIVIVLEGMIVAIQVIRLQYYEFFSKFFNETGREFKPFRFE